MDKNQAVHQWVNGFNAFPYSMIKTLMEHDIDSWRELTPFLYGDRVYEYKSGNYGEITGYDEETDTYCIELDDGDEIYVEAIDVQLERDGFLPMWGTLWQFGNDCDDYWLEELGGIRAMADCGFRIYKHDEWGYFFGIDGCGYSFYEAHWIPLYEKRGLKWHDEED